MSETKLTAATDESTTSTLEQFVLSPLRNLWDEVVHHLPAVTTAIIVGFVLYIVARLLRGLLERILRLTKIDNSLEGTRFASILQAFSKDLTTSKAIAYLVYIATILLAWTAAADIVGLTVVRETLQSVLSFMPKLASSLLVLALGGFLASTARKAVEALLSEVHSPYARILESITEIFLLVIVGTLAIQVLGVDTSMITANLSLLMGSVLCLMLFLFAWSMRRPAEEIIANYYLRRLLRLGDHVRFENAEGTVTAFTPLGVLVTDAEKKDTFVPARNLLNGLTREGAKPPID